MSRTFEWVPIVEPPVGGAVSLDLWHILVEAFDYFWEEPTEVTLVVKDLPMLNGIRAAGTEDVTREAEELIAAVEAHKQIKIYTVY